MTGISIVKSAAAEKIERCSAQMLLKYPWWATLYLQLIRIETESVPTMAVDGTHLFFNPNFTESLTDKECVGVLLHETAHIVFLHCYRRKYRDPLRWNTACDKAVNAVLVEANIVLPKGGVPPGPTGKLAEELYETITPEEVALYEDHDVREAGSVDAGGKSAKDGMTERDWRDAIAGSRGYMPDSIARTVGEATAPRKDWKEELARFVHSTCKSNTRTWSRQSRRIHGLPGWSREVESNIVIVLDTSGSVTGAILSAFAAECQAITARRANLPQPLARQQELLRPYVA